MAQIINYRKIGGYLFFLIAIGLFCLQMIYFFIHSRFIVEYVDNRIFYFLNILIIVSIVLSNFLLLKISKKWKMIVGSITVILLLLHVGLAINNSYKTKHVLSISPDLKHVLVIKENRETAVATHYRSYYGIFARPKESLPYKTNGHFKVKWLEKDIAAVTYKAANNTIHQFIGTYGYRDGGYSYSYVGPSIHGEWKADNIKVISASEGITVYSNGIAESYDWDQVVQFGTIAVVLMGRNNEAEWTIALNESFKSNSNESIPPSGEITIYKATMDINEPVMLQYKTS
ncbi:hypothetical protein J7E71_18845 [Mesobacillus foraminis]|uniref:hypothetical protein n=1 Tax=Mesobacillus foraminis TaxID=279826 RepID=UPI001BE84BE6|nr:hypothetical protein [Mesobacillus foraminis]MBT2757935.1 hypothetical protein [Mesobacillus foraminis]